MKKISFWQILNQFWQLNHVRGSPIVNSLENSGVTSVNKPFLTVKEYNELIEGINMEKKNFVNVETTKEQYLKFKEYIKANKWLSHYTYVAYYIFKHRLVGEERDKYLEDEVKNRCWKGLYTGRICGNGGDMTDKYAVPLFKNLVIEKYNEFANEA